MNASNARPTAPGMKSSTHPTGRCNGLASTLLALLVLLSLHRYIGINHDAALYLGEALMERSPGIFQHDLFFSHGSQGSYTLLPWLLSQIFQWVSPANVFLVGTLTGLLAFTAAAWFFLRTILPAHQRYWAFLGVLCLPTAYGVVHIFGYAEPFLTSRPLAEAFCLTGLGLLTRRHLLPAALCALIAGVLHPLQAVAACLVAWPWLVLQDRRWLHALWLCLPLALLGWFGPPPLNGLFRVFDPAWLKIVQDVTGQLFLMSWKSADYCVLAFDVLILIQAWRTLPKPFSQWCLAALIGLAMGLGGTLVFADGLHLVLPTALQLWRVHWMAHLLAMASVAALMCRDFHAKEPGRALCLGLALLLAQGASWIWLPFALLYSFWTRALGIEPSPIKHLLGTLCLLGSLVLFALYAANEWLPFRMAHYRLDLYAFDRRILIFPLVSLGLPFMATWLWRRSGASLRWCLMLGVLTPLLLLGACRWDARPPIAHLVEGGQVGPSVFGPTLPEHAQVFWMNDQFPTVWLGLGRAEYFSVRQLAGVVFNRGTAIEANQRLDRVTLAIREDLYCQQLPQARRERCQLDDEAMRNACQPGPTRRPDYMVLRYHQPQRSLGRWDFIDPATGQAAVTYWLYSCEQVMRDLNANARTDAK